MIRRPRFKNDLHVRTIADDLVAATSSRGELFIEGYLCPLIVAEIDGRRSSKEILDNLRETLTALDFEVGLAALEDHGWIVDADTDSDPDPGADRGSADSRRLEIETEAPAGSLDNATFSVHTTGSLDTVDLVSQLEAFGLQRNDVGDIALVLTDDYFCDEIGRLETRFREEQQRWVLAKPSGPVLWIGPFFEPGEPGCWSCLVERMRASRGPEAPRRPENFAPSISNRRSVAQLVVTQLADHLSGDPSADLRAHLVSTDLARLVCDRHSLVARPGCASCAPAPSHRDRTTPPRVSPRTRPLRLDAHQAVRWRDGGLRTAAPEVTWDRYRHLVSPLTGVVSSVSSYAGDDSPIHVFQADHLFTKASDARDASRVGHRRRSAGKGMEPVQARVSALCEALERFSGLFRGDEPRRRARLSDLGEEAIDPRLCLHFSPEQFANRSAWNREPSIYTWVPNPFDDDREIDWTPLWSLTDDRQVYLPTAFCYYGVPLPENHHFCRADSNGNAAGNTIEEAVLQGFLELVERDAVAIWWYNRIRRPGVEIESFDTPELSRLAAHYESLGRPLQLLDVTSDSGIPTFAATSWSPESGGEDLLLGFGAHFDPVLAASRALTEMNQFLPGSLVGSKRRLVSATPEDLDHLRPDPSQHLRRHGEFRGFEEADLAAYLERSLDTVLALGLQLLVLDQTRADIGLPVVKVVVPGLRHYWARFGPGRLDRVPVELGWLPEALPEVEMNPSWIVI